MDAVTLIPLFLFVGAVAGFLAGLLGIGGGIIFIPLFLWVFPLAGFAPEVVTHAAFGTSLAAIVPTAVSSAVAHRRRSNVDWHQVYRLAVGATAGAIAGGMLASGLSGVSLKFYFGLMQIAIGMKLFLRPRHLPPERRNGPPLWQLLVIGFATGGFSAFFGVGGGVIAVPLMVLFLQLPTNLAVGNSSALIAVSSFFGALSYIIHGWGIPGLPSFSLGYMNWLVALVVAPTAIGFAGLGARIAARISDDKLLKIFSLFLIGIGLRIVAGAI